MRNHNHHKNTTNDETTPTFMNRGNRFETDEDEEDTGGYDPDGYVPNCWRMVDRNGHAAAAQKDKDDETVEREIEYCIYNIYIVLF
jgi:hypothetical protein